MSKHDDRDDGRFHPSDGADLERELSIVEEEESMTEPLTIEEIEQGKRKTEVAPLLDDDCLSCGEGIPLNNECPNSKRACGHHCNHSWTHDECCWCGQHFGGENE